MEIMEIGRRPDGTQWADDDNDGFGDNPNGTNSDRYTNDSLRWSDRDGDGYSDQEGDDDFVNDPTQCLTQMVTVMETTRMETVNPKTQLVVENDSSEWRDTDGDGYGNNGDWALDDGTQWEILTVTTDGDNPNGTNGDQFLNDSLRWSDRDGDGYSDQEGDDDFAFPLRPYSVERWR